MAPRPDPDQASSPVPAPEEEGREAGLVVAAAAHDLNNALSVIRGCASMLRLLPGLTPEQARELDDLDRAWRHGAELARQMAAYGRRETSSEDIDLNAAVLGMEWLLRRICRKGVEVELALDPDAGRVRMKAVRLEQALLNLAANARDAMPRGGRLRIETSAVPAGGPPAVLRLPPGRYALLAVSDTGAGLSAEARGGLFEPYRTGKGAAGHGLGLFSVRRAVVSAGGQVRAVSRPEGSGACFQLFLPRP